MDENEPILKGFYSNHTSTMLNKGYDKHLNSNRPLLLGEAEDRKDIIEQMKLIAHPRLVEFIGAGIDKIGNSIPGRSRSFGQHYRCDEDLLLGFLNRIDSLERQVFDLEHEAKEDVYDER